MSTPNAFLHSGFIDGDEVTTILLPARSGLTIGLKLSKIFAPALAAAASTLEDKGFYDHKVMAAHLIMSMDEKEVVDIVFTLLSSLAVNGVTVQPDNHYRGNYPLMVKHLAFVMEANFQTFFIESISKDLSSIFNLLTEKQDHVEPEKQ